MNLQTGVIVFFTGLSGAGKTTLARALTNVLEANGRKVTLLDGDEIRTWLSNGLGFSRQDRDTNILRIGRVATEVARHGGIAICAAIAPYPEARMKVRSMAESAGVAYIEVYLSTSIEICERRDPKGLYRQVRQGSMLGFTGIDDPYEPPLAPTITLDTNECDVSSAVSVLLEALKK